MGISIVSFTNMSSNQTPAELSIRNGDAFVVGGKRFVRDGLFFVEAARNNKYSRAARLNIGDLSYANDVLTVGDETVKLVWE